MHSLFIGLGGAGTYAVAELKRKMLDFGYDVRQDNFLFIDTEQKIKDEYDFIDDGFVPLSGDSNTTYSVNSVRNDAEEACKAHSDAMAVQGRHFFTWFDKSSPSLKSNRDLTAGAEGARMFTRVMLWKNYEIIKSRINNALSYLDENNKDQRIERIYLVSGTCGGTGSGSVLDLMYMLGEIQNSNQAHDVDLKLTTILVMPHGYIKDLKSADVRYEKYQTNAFAMLDEINACTKDFYLVEGGNEGKSFFKYRCRGDVNQQPFGFNVCNTLFMLDSYDNKYKKGTLDFAQVSDNVSNFLFAMESGSAAQEISEGNFCNITNTQIQSSVSVPYIKGFCATGMYVVQTWEEIIRKYVREKFIYQMYQHGFVGSDALKLEQNDMTKRAEDSKFSEILTDLKKTFLESTKSDFNQIFSVNKKDILKGVAAQMQDATATKENKIDDIFAKHPKKANWESLHSNMADFLVSVRKSTYSFCMNLVKQYSIRHAIAIINYLDTKYNGKYGEQKGLVDSNCNLTIDPPLFGGDRLDSCKKAFDAYIDYLVYRNLSNENDGYFDVCRNCLATAVDNIQTESRTLPNSDNQIREWERKFEYYLTSLRTDKTKKLIPELPENLLKQKNHELDRSYATLVIQTDDNKPDLSWDENNGKLLYSFKKQIMNEILSENGTWDSNWFLIEGNSFANHCSTILDEFMRKVVEKANASCLSQNEALSIPFMDVYKDLDVNSKKDVEDALVNYADIALSLTKPAESYGTISGQIVYLSKGLNEREGIGKELKTETTKRITGGRMGVSISSSVISDRLIKLYVRSGYGFDDYEFFKEYSNYFATYYRNSSQDCHQCFIHKKFLTARNEGMTLNELFDSDAKKDYQESLKNLWREKEGMTFKFAILYLVRLLMEQKDIGVMTHFNPIDSFLKETKDASTKSWMITLGTTNDFKNNPSMPIYTMKASMNFNMNDSFSRGDIEPYKTYLDFWYDILKVLARQANSFLTVTKMNQILNEVYTELYSLLSVQEQDDLSNLKQRYSTYLISNDVVQKDKYDKPILKEWAWKKFFEDCLIGLFDR